MTVDLTKAEMQALMAALDAGVKALGARIVVPLAPVLTKLEDAANGADD